MRLAGEQRVAGACSPTIAHQLAGELPRMTVVRELGASISSVNTRGQAVMRYLLTAFLQTPLIERQVVFREIDGSPSTPRRLSSRASKNTLPLMSRYWERAHIITDGWCVSSWMLPGTDLATRAGPYSHVSSPVNTIVNTRCKCRGARRNENPTTRVFPRASENGAHDRRC